MRLGVHRKQRKMVEKQRENVPGVTKMLCDINCHFLESRMLEVSGNDLSYPTYHPNDLFRSRGGFYWGLTSRTLTTSSPLTIRYSNLQLSILRWKKKGERAKRFVKESGWVTSTSIRKSVVGSSRRSGLNQAYSFKLSSNGSFNGSLLIVSYISSNKLASSKTLGILLFGPTSSFR